MSIAPPSDIVMDVAQAADPTTRDAALARLVQLGSGVDPTAGDFSSTVGAVGKPAGSTTNGPISVDIGTHGAYQHAARPMSPYQKFEAVLLQNFLQETLPKDDELFGDVASADMMRSMMAEQMANQMAASGRFGIARMLEKHEKSPARAALPATSFQPGPTGIPAMPLGLPVTSTSRS